MNWQPISTAPKETALLLATEFFGKGDWRIKCGSFYDGEWHVWGASWTPSHWMPLPAAPGEKCRTCSGHGAVGNILTAEPCPDCTPAPVAPGARVLTTEDMESLSLTHGLSGDIEEMAIIVETMVLDRMAAADGPFERQMSDWAHGDSVDALRYRWLRANRDAMLLTSFFGHGCTNRSIFEVDAAIDEAIWPDPATDYP
jgi:hypothetical protein